MIDTFRREHGLSFDHLRPQELALAKTLAREKFGTAAWTAEVA